MSQATDQSSRHGHEGLILALACLAQFMVVLDVSVVNVALPSIGRDLGFSPAGLQWVVNAYVLAFAGFLLLGGRAADLFGRRRIFILGAAAFTAASLVGGLATSAGVLTGARVAQGLGGALLSPATLTVIVTTFQGPRLAKALGMWGAVGGAGGAIGSLLGGVLTAELSWRWVLFINVPIGIGIVAGALAWLSELARREPGAKLDVAGAVLVTTGLSSIVYGIVGTTEHGWSSPNTVGWLAAGAVLLAGFVLVEARVASRPLVPLAFLAKRTTATTNLVMLLVGSAFFSMWYFLTLYFQEVHGWSALTTGFAFAPMAVSIIIGAQLTTRMMVRVGERPMILIGTTTATLGFVWLSQVSATSAYVPDVILPSLLVSFSLGLLFSPLAASATSVADHTQAGLASGILNSSRQIGGSLGLAVLATVAAHATIHAASDLTKAEALTQGFDLAFMVAAGICAAAILGALALPRHARKPTATEAAEAAALATEVD